MGKGSQWRKGTNYKAYQESDYWKYRDERLKKTKIDIIEKKEESPEYIQLDIKFNAD